MRIPALTFVFLVAAGSLVSASPAREETTERISYNHKARAQAQADIDPGWIALASATPASNGREFIVLGADAGSFTRLRITAASGRPRVRAVRVDYQDGSQKTYAIGKILDARVRPVYVDLRGARELRQIIVFSDRASNGTYVVAGNTGDIVAMR
jgi:hypothetical protein